jgi:8-oxo-dGTP pyrophosphatase MutT (NUDIX family)
MTKRDLTKRMRRAVVGTAKLGRPPSLQVAALCYRQRGKSLRILLITSRDTGRWVTPKGWPMRNRTEPEAAAREAYEEAGIRGDVSTRHVGHYSYKKWLGNGRAIPCLVRVYPLRVREMLKSYPETRQRRNKWFSQAKAAKKVMEPELAALIRAFEPSPE